MVIPAGLTMRRGALERHADEADLHAADVLDRVRREDRSVALLVDDVRGEHRVVRAGEAVAVLAAVDRVAAAVLQAQQLGDALVELVVADARDVEAEASSSRRPSGSSWNAALTSGRRAHQVAGGHGEAVAATPAPARRAAA